MFCRKVKSPVYGLTISLVTKGKCCVNILEKSCYLSIKL